jgi:hypothetical protein
MKEELANNAPWGRTVYYLIGHGVTMPPFTFSVSPET